MVKPKNRPIEPVVDPTEYTGMNRWTQPLHSDGHVLTLAESHPAQPPWQVLHPALELDIDQRIHQFIALLHATDQELWDHIRQMSLQKDVIYRWQQRRIQLLLETDWTLQKEQRLRDYVTALLFERVYSQTLQRRDTFHHLQKKGWQDEDAFRRLHEEMFKARLERDRQFIAKKWRSQYVAELKVPNEKKLIHKLKENDFELDQHTKAILRHYDLARRSSARIFSQSLMRGLSLANDQAFQTNSVREIKAVLHSLESQWASLFKESKALASILLPVIRNQSDIRTEMDGETGAHGRFRVEKERYDGPLKEEIHSEGVRLSQFRSVRGPRLRISEADRRIVVHRYNRHNRLESSQNLQAESHYSTVATPGAEPPEPMNGSRGEPAEREQALNSYHHLAQQALHPQGLAEALRGEFSFDIPRVRSEAAQELEKTVKEHQSEKKAAHQVGVTGEQVSRLEAHQKTVNQLLAGHDYAKQSLLLGPSATRPLAVESDPRPQDQKEQDQVEAIRGLATAEEIPAKKKETAS